MVVSGRSPIRNLIIAVGKLMTIDRFGDAFAPARAPIHVGLGCREFSGPGSNWQLAPYLGYGV